MLKESRKDARDVITARSKDREYEKPRMHSEKVFVVGFDAEIFILCGGGAVTWSAGMCFS